MTTVDPWALLIAEVASVWPVDRFADVGVVVGCSGGADSVALLRALDQLVKATGKSPGFLVVAHFNHHLRGEQSDRDAAFVGELAEHLRWRFELGHGDASRSDEATLRDARFAFFENVLRRVGARYLALAHSQDDNVETVLHRLMRGTGPKGLAGIEPFRPLAAAPPFSDFVVARPLLRFGRLEIRNALAAQGFRWCEDASNQSQQYQRNWIRNTLIPLMESRYPSASESIARTTDQQLDWSSAVGTLAEAWLDQAKLDDDPLTVRCIDSAKFPEMPGPSFKAAGRRAIVTEALRRCWLRHDWPLASMSQRHWIRLCNLICDGSESAITLPGCIQVRRDGDRATFARDRN